MDSAHLLSVYQKAECLFTLEQIEAALDKLISQLVRDFSEKNPLVIGVMNGSLATLGYLLPRLPFMLEVDYVHATRYQGELRGMELVWKRKPDVSLKDRHVLLVDDLLDQGITLKAIADYCRLEGAASVAILVLGKKHIADYTAPIVADYVALDIPDKYIFGFGMDYQNYWRNASGIFAVE
jgi:hypoxanthine phosphoribosyltransferase